MTHINALFSQERLRFQNVKIAYFASHLFELSISTWGSVYISTEGWLAG